MGPNGGTYVDAGGGGGGGDDSCNTETGDIDGGGDDDCKTEDGSKGSTGVGEGGRGSFTDLAIHVSLNLPN